ncbi:hypothetical protein D3C72_2128760 [compost metagenome]
MSHTTQYVLPQGLQQAVLAIVAQHEIGAGAQMFLPLVPGFRLWLLQRALAHAEVPESQSDQGDQGDQGLGEMAQQQCRQAVVLGIEQQGHSGIDG